jgi:hypothetical protein
MVKMANLIEVSGRSDCSSFTLDCNGVTGRADYGVALIAVFMPLFSVDYTVDSQYTTIHKEPSLDAYEKVDCSTKSSA